MSSSNGIGDGITTIVTTIGRYFIEQAEERRARAEMQRAAREAQEHEAQVERKQAEWRAEVEGQKSHGDAGDASEHEAITALGGAGPEFDEGFF